MFTAEINYNNRLSTYCSLIYRSLANIEQEQWWIGWLHLGCFVCRNLLWFSTGDYWTVDPRLRCLSSLFHEMLNWNAGIRQIVGHVFLRYSYVFSQFLFCFPNIFSLVILTFNGVYHAISVHELAFVFPWT